MIVRLDDLLRQGLVVLSFYGGAWPVLQSRARAALQKALPAIRSLAAPLIAHHCAFSASTGVPTDVSREIQGRLYPGYSSTYSLPTGWCLVRLASKLTLLFSLAQQYRYSGCTRDDFAAKNAAARAAIEKYGELPQDVLEGTRRSRFAPPIVRRSPLASSSSRPVVAPSEDASDPDETSDAVVADDEDEPA